MKITRQVEILIETRETALVPAVRTDIRQWCPICSAEVSMVTPEQATELASVTPRTIYTWIEAARIHFEEAADGSLFICRRSLGK